MSCKIDRVSEVKVSHFLKNHELVNQVSRFSKNQELAKLMLAFFSKLKVSRVRVRLVPIMLKLELELMNLDCFSCFLFPLLFIHS